MGMFPSGRKKLLKEFFVRCTRLLIQARSLDEFTQILTHVLTIAYSQTECTIERSLNFIFQLLEGTSTYEEILDTKETIFNIDDTLNEEEEKLNETCATSSNLQLLLENINDNSLKTASANITKHSITKINAYCISQFGKKLIKHLCYGVMSW